MKKKFRLLAVFILLLFPVMKGNSLLGIGGWVGDKIDKVGGFLDGLAGRPMELATNSSLDNMQAKLNGNIDSLDRVMGRNARQFTGDLDEVLRLREDQLEGLLNRNVHDLNSGLSENIKQFSESLQLSIDGLRSVESFFAKGLWTWAKLLAQLVVFLLVLYFIFKTYDRVNDGGSLSKTQFKKLVAESRFYVISFFISVFIIFLFRPITGRYIDSDFEKQKRIYSDNVVTALKLFDYKTAMLYAVGLSKLEPSNSEYDYLVKKVDLLKDLLVLIREVQVSNEALHAKYEYLKESFNTNEIDDPEFYIISALFKRNYYNSKKGYLLAAVDCYEFLNRKNSKGKIEFEFHLEPYTYDILNVYYLNPYDEKLLNDKLKEDSIQCDKSVVSILSADTAFFNENFGYPILNLKQTAYRRLREDENMYVEFLNDTSNTARKNTLIDRWISTLKFINSTKYKKIYANQSMIFNDFLAPAMLKNYTSSKIDSLNNLCNDIFQTEKIETSIKDSLGHVFTFKRLLSAMLVAVTDGAEARGTKVAEILHDKQFFYPRADALTDAYFQIRNLPNTQQTDSFKLAIFRNAIKLASELNLYYSKNKVRTPFCYELIDLARKQLPLIFQQDPVLLTNLKSEADAILENAYYSY